MMMFRYLLYIISILTRNRLYKYPLMNPQTQEEEQNLQTNQVAETIELGGPN